MTIVYVVLEEYPWPKLEWVNYKIYSSVANALKYFEKYSNVKITIADCGYDEYFSRDRGLLKKITIQNNKYNCGVRNFYIKEVVVD